jgi:hypothetical protein
MCHKPAIQYIKHKYGLTVKPLSCCEDHSYRPSDYEIPCWTEISENEYIIALDEFVVAEIMIS